MCKYCDKNIEVPEGKVVKYNETPKIIEFVDKEPVRTKIYEEFYKNLQMLKEM